MVLRPSRSSFTAAFLLVVAAAQSNCSVVFDTAPTALVEDAGPDANAEAADADLTPERWTPSETWVQGLQRFFVTGMIDDGDFALVGSLDAPFQLPSGDQVLVDGGADIGFLTIDFDTGEPQALSTLGGPGSSAVMDVKSSPAGHSLVGLYQGQVSVCADAQDLACTLVAPSPALSAFGLASSALLSAEATPEKQTFVGVADPTGRSQPEVTTLVNSGLALVGAHVIVGAFRSPATVRDGTLLDNSDPATQNLFLLQTGNSGEVLRQLVPDSEGDQVAWSVEDSTLGGLYVAGSYDGTLDLGVDGIDSFPDSTTRALFAANLANNFLSGQWGVAVGNGISNSPILTAVRNNGNLLVAASFLGTLALVNGDTLEAPSQSENVVVIELNTAGEILWATSLGGDGAARPRGLVITGNGDVVVGGEFFGTMPAGQDTLSSEGAMDGFVVRLTADGEVRGGLSVGSTGAGDDANDRVTRLLSGPDDSILVGVQYGSQVVIDGEFAAPGNYLHRFDD